MKIGHSSGWVCGGTPRGKPTDGGSRVAQMGSPDISLDSPPVPRYFGKIDFFDPEWASPLGLKGTGWGQNMKIGNISGWVCGGTPG